MTEAAWIPFAVAVAAVLAAAALVAVLLIGRGLRDAAAAQAQRSADSQAETLRWVSEQLTASLDRFHGRLGDLERQLGDRQAASAEILRRGVAEQLDALSGSVNRQLAASQETLGTSLTGATEVFGSLQRRLGHVSEMAVRMEQLGRSVDELGKILRVPKLRGLMGEQTLEVLLRQVLPKGSWRLQHRFSDGRTVDAVVVLGVELLPIDAKFPLESYQRLAAAGDAAALRAARRDFVRTVKIRIDEISSRYIRPEEGTVDFALMFIAAEGVYGEVVSGGDAADGGGDLLEHALSRRVLPVSPATIFAYLSIVATGLHGFEVETRAKEIVRSIAAAGGEIERLRDDLTVLGKHLHNAAQRFGEVERRLDRVEARIHDTARLGEDRAGAPE